MVESHLFFWKIKTTVGSRALLGRCLCQEAKKQKWRETTVKEAVYPHPTPISPKYLKFTLIALDNACLCVFFYQLD